MSKKIKSFIISFIILIIGIITLVVPTLAVQAAKPANCYGNTKIDLGGVIADVEVCNEDGEKGTYLGVLQSRDEGLWPTSSFGIVRQSDDEIKDLVIVHSWSRTLTGPETFETVTFVPKPGNYYAVKSGDEVLYTFRVAKEKPMQSKSRKDAPTITVLRGSEQLEAKVSVLAQEPSGTNAGILEYRDRDGLPMNDELRITWFTENGVDHFKILSWDERGHGYVLDRFIAPITGKPEAYILVEYVEVSVYVQLAPEP